MYIASTAKIRKETRPCKAKLRHAARAAPLPAQPPHGPFSAIRSRVLRDGRCKRGPGKITIFVYHTKGIMNEDLANIQYSSIHDYKYAQWFRDVQFNGETLSDEERKEVVAVIDESIAQYSDGLPLIYNARESFKDKHDEFCKVYRTVASMLQFALITMIDSMVASKYFLLADRDYDRRFMRGKLKVILNECFKKLYGFNEKTYKKSEWDKLLPMMHNFPEIINRQYRELTFLLEKLAKSSPWWKEERDLETHYYDANKLYESRQEEIIESKVMMDSLKLFETLRAVNCFLTNVHACCLNYLIDKYKRGELSEQPTDISGKFAIFAE